MDSRLTSAQGAADDLARARDPEVTGPDLLKLAVHRSAKVRAAVASRRDCPPAALISLGHDYDVDVLRALLTNVRTPSSVVRQLADHRNTGIADAAVQRLRNSFR